MAEMIEDLCEEKKFPDEEWAAMQVLVDAAKGKWSNADGETHRWQARSYLLLRCITGTGAIEQVIWSGSGYEV